MKTVDVIMVLGTNTNPWRNLERAMAELCEAMPGIFFTEPIVTKPIGMESDDFLNCMAEAATAETLERLTHLVKCIERMLGDDSHSGNVVNMDIDILQYGNRKLRPDDWERDYVKVLYAKLADKKRKKHE